MRMRATTNERKEEKESRKEEEKDREEARGSEQAWKHKRKKKRKKKRACTSLKTCRAPDPGCPDGPGLRYGRNGQQK